MAKDYIDFRKVERLSFHDENVAISSKALKLGEEVGELQAAILELIGSPNASASSKVDEGKEATEVVTECCDVINVAMEFVGPLLHDITNQEYKY